MVLSDVGRIPDPTIRAMTTEVKVTDRHGLRTETVSL